MTSKKVVHLIRNGELLLKDDPSRIREEVEVIFESKFGFAPMLQESIDEGEFQIYLHTDTYDDLSDDEIDKLDRLGINEDPDDCTEAIKNVLEVNFLLETEFLG